jgi:hypothetical protein
MECVTARMKPVHEFGGLLEGPVRPTREFELIDAHHGQSMIEAGKGRFTDAGLWRPGQIENGDIGEPPSVAIQNAVKMRRRHPGLRATADDQNLSGEHSDSSIYPGFAGLTLPAVPTICSQRLRSVSQGGPIQPPGNDVGK